VFQKVSQESFAPIDLGMSRHLIETGNIITLLLNITFHEMAIACGVEKRISARLQLD
jgi:hypothetical protein